MRRALVVRGLVLGLAVSAAACSQAKDAVPTNVRPPHPGVPAAAGDVTGIFRSIHQGLLQLRSNGELVLILPEGPGPTSGTFTLQAGHLAVLTKDCGAAAGDYDLAVTGEPQAGKAVLTFTAVHDSCDERRHYLTVDPWVYANS